MPVSVARADRARPNVSCGRARSVAERTGGSGERPRAGYPGPQRVRPRNSVSLLPVPQSKSKRSRYTPPPPKKADPSPLWVPVVLTTLLACGLAVIVLNYLNMLPGADTEN